MIIGYETEAIISVTTATWVFWITVFTFVTLGILAGLQYYSNQRSR